MPGRWTRKPPYGTPLDRSHPLAQGLVGLWPLNEGAGQPVNAVDGTLAASNSMPWTADAQGSALLNTGVSKYVEVNTPAGTPLSVTGTQISWGAWVYPTTSGNYQAVLTLTAGGADSQRQYACYLNASGQGVYYVSLAGANITQGSASPGWATNQWNHVFCTYDGANLKVYQNGRLGLTVAASRTIAAISGASLYWGYDPAAASFGLNGRVDAPAVWHRCLSPAEVAAIGSSRAAIWDLFEPDAHPMAIYPGAVGPITTVYFGDLGFGYEGHLFRPFDANPAVMADSSLAGPFDGGTGSIADGALAFAFGAGPGGAGLDGSLALAIDAGSGTGSDRSLVGLLDAGSGLGFEANAAPSPAGFIPIGKTIASGQGASVGVPIGWTVSPGDLILVTVAINASTSVSVADTAGNTYSPAASISTNWPASIYYSIAATGGAGITVNVTFGASVFYGVAALEYAAPGTISLDTTGTGSGTGTTAQPSAPLALAGTGELVGLLANVGANALTYTAGSGYAVEESTGAGGVKDFAFEDALSLSGSVTPSLTMSASNSWSAVAVAFKWTSGSVAFVYAGDSAGGSEGGLGGKIDPGSGTAADSALPLWYAAEIAVGADSGLRLATAGDSFGESEASLATLTTVEYGQDLGSAASASLGLAIGGEAGNGPDAASWASTLTIGDSAGLASAGLSVAILGDYGAASSASVRTILSIASVSGIDDALASEGWFVLVVSAIPRAYWFAPEAARLVPIDAMDPDAFEVDPYAARLVVLAAMDPDSFEVDPYAARVIEP